MAFSWKFFNEMDKKSVDKLGETVQHIVDTHQRIHGFSGAGLKEDEEQALENLMKKYKKKLDDAIGVLAEFDKELSGIADSVDARISK